MLLMTILMMVFGTPLFVISADFWMQHLCAAWHVGCDPVHLIEYFDK